MNLIIKYFFVIYFNQWKVDTTNETSNIFNNYIILFIFNHNIYKKSCKIEQEISVNFSNYSAHDYFDDWIDTKFLKRLMNEKKFLVLCLLNNNILKRQSKVSLIEKGI